MANAPAKKERDVFLDFLKLLNCILVLLAHAGWMFGGMYGLESAVASIDNPLAAWSYLYREVPAIGPFVGYYTLSFFTFTTGYWFMTAFKKVKNSGLMGKGIDTKLAIRYFGQNYSAYWPFILYAVLFAFVVTHLVYPTLWTSNPMNLLVDLQNSIMQLLGFHSAGFSIAEGLYMEPSAFGGMGFDTMSNGYTDATRLLLSYNGIVWYMSALIVFGVAWFVIFMKSESFGAFVLAPFTFALFNTFFSQVSGYELAMNLGLSTEYLRLFGPWCTGIWAWYIVDYLKKAELSKKAVNVLSILCAGGFIWWCVLLLTPKHSMYHMDISLGICMIILLSGRDHFSKWVNKVLRKIPGIKHINTLSMSIFLHHLPIMYTLTYFYEAGTFEWLNKFNTIEAMVLFEIGICVVITIPYYFIETYGIKRLGKAIRKLFKLDEPVVLETPASTEVK